MIKGEGLFCSYEAYEDDNLIKIPVLFGVDIKIEKGSFVGILGHNGSGKSTLVKTFNGIVSPDKGEVFVDDIKIDRDSLYDVRKKVGMVFQNPDNQLVATIVEEDVAFGPENLGVPPEEIRQRVDFALSVVDMEEYINHSPHKLSGGQKQKIAIAGIIAMSPSYIVLDEATAMLDPKGREDVIKTVKKLNREYGITIVLITHYMEEAALCDKLIVLNDGKVCMEGTPKEIFSRTEEMKKLKLGVPQSTEIAYYLKNMGLDLDTPLSPDEFLNNTELL